MRGEVFGIGGRTFFTMGGAAGHDIQNGVLDMKNPDFEKMYKLLRQQNLFLRINHLSWWEQELPTQNELDEGWKNLCAHGKKVDYVLSHSAPTKLQREIQTGIGDYTHPENELTEFLQKVYDQCEFKDWFCGHYHHAIDVKKDFHVLYEDIVSL